MKIHFIALGGSIMHSLAIALKQSGHVITGSDDNIYDPAKSRLEVHGLLPETPGWDPSRINGTLDAVILGMHAFQDNPELEQAKSLQIPIYSFPEFIYEQSRNKHRVVITGSYGKTTVTAMIMHVLKGVGKDFDYLVGAQVPGFDNPVRITEDAPLIVVEGDEYLSSKIDPRPKFLHYQGHMVVINGISWDHINVFPTEEAYVKQFADLLQSLEKAADVIYNQEDKHLVQLIKQFTNESYYLHPFKAPSSQVRKGNWEIKLEGKKQQVQIIGEHNMVNIAAAWKACELLSVELPDFLHHISTFKGAAIRMEIVHQDENSVIIRDYAHAPEKVKATLDAVKTTFKDHTVIACVELHTFSSLNRDFLPRYSRTLTTADHAIVFVKPDQFAKRRMEPLREEEIRKAFDEKKLIYIQAVDDLQQQIKSFAKGKYAILLMSSGNFGGMEIHQLLKELTVE